MPYWLPFNVESERGVQPQTVLRLLTDLCRFSLEKDEMFSRFSETAKNNPFPAPYSVAKCSSEPVSQPRSSRIMAAPNIEGSGKPAF